MKRELRTNVIYKPVKGGRQHHEAALEAVADGLVDLILGRVAPQPSIEPRSSSDHLPRSPHQARRLESDKIEGLDVITSAL